MSVIEPLRNLSEVQYLEDARKLEIYTFQRTIKMPKRYNHFKKVLENCAINCYNNCKLGNSIFLKDEESLKERKHKFEKALQNLYIMSSQIDIARELKLCERITNKQWAHWLGLILTEILQIKNIEISDLNRIKK